MRSRATSCTRREATGRLWNATDERAGAPEIISPAGINHFFVEPAALIEGASFDDEQFGALSDAYGLEMDFASVSHIVEAHGLVADETGLDPEVGRGC